MRPCHLPRVLFHVTTVTVYCTSHPVANGDIACDVRRSALSRLQTQHPVPRWSLEASAEGGEIIRQEGGGSAGPRPPAPSTEVGFCWISFISLRPTLRAGADVSGPPTHTLITMHYFIIHPFLSFPLNWSQYYLFIDLFLFVLPYLL